MARFLEMGGVVERERRICNGLFWGCGLKKWSPPVVPGMHEVHFSENG